MSPTARSLALLRRQGFVCQVVERWCTYSRRRIDLFGCIDIVAVYGRPGSIIGIQATSASNQTARIKKIKAEPRAKEWLQSGGRIFVHGWGKRKVKRGGRAVRYVVSETEIFADEIHPLPQ